MKRSLRMHLDEETQANIRFIGNAFVFAVIRSILAVAIILIIGGVG